jgi:hypothetical protein
VEARAVSNRALLSLLAAETARPKLLGSNVTAMA